MEDLQEIIEEGKIYKGKKKNTSVIIYNNQVVVLSDIWKKKNKTNWILTAFYK